MILYWLYEALVGAGFSVLQDVLEVLSFDVFISNLEVLSLYMLDIISYVYFFLPVTYLLPLFSIVFGWIVVKIAMALIRVVNELIPFI